MTRIDLQTPFLEQGIQNINFFNGRILTGLAMQEAQEANHRQHRQLGRAIGPGVVKGLTVSQAASGESATTPIVNVAEGLAINAEGQALELHTSVEVSLIIPEDTSAQEAGLFAACAAVSSDDIYTNEGPYILAISPASDLQGSAPMHGVNGNGRADTCGFAYEVEGVQFKLVYVDLKDPTLVPDDIGSSVNAVKDKSDPASVSRLRNLLAHLCLGTTETNAFSRDLFSQFVQNPVPLSYSLLDKLRDQQRLSACDVPLALIYWTSSGVKIIDMHSVRRRVTRLSPSIHWPPIVSEQRLAEGEAAFLQFQEQVAYLTRTGVLQSQIASIQARNYFRFLPAAGILPVQADEAAQGLDYPTFFNNLNAPSPDPIDGAVVPALLRSAMLYPPIDLETPSLIRLYAVRENVKQIRTTPATASQIYLIFTSEYIPPVAGRPVLVKPSPDQPDSSTPGTGGLDVRFVDQVQNLTREAAAAQSVAAVKGIGSKRAQALAALNIHTIDDLAKAPLDQVRQATGLGQTAANDFIITAKKLLGDV